METKRYTIIIFAENSPGVLYRIADLFLRRNVNIDSLTVSETQTKETARFTIVVNTTATAVEKTVKQLYRIIEISKVNSMEDTELTFKEVALIKVSAKNKKEREELTNLVTLAKGLIIHVTPEAITIEKTGTEEEIDSLVKLVRPLGMKEFVRSGRIAVTKESEK